MELTKHKTMIAVTAATLCSIFAFAAFGQVKKQLPKQRVSTSQANMLLEEGKKLAQEGTNESFKVAIEKFADASQLYEELGEYEQAIEAYEKAISLQETLKLTFDLSVTYRSLGRNYSQIGEYAKALYSYMRISS